MSLLGTHIKEADTMKLFKQDQSLVKQDIGESIQGVIESYSSNILVGYFHLSPVKIHLSFSLEGRLRTAATSEEEILEWLISTVGIHFTDISDAEIKYVHCFNFKVNDN